ncbi:hypothetical protein SAMN02990966_07764 [Rhodospirillales bacterium URHD0017]|nr:hypothetical protein SAMN02990966_07764 [Rhodospirillales bacterium URHD0017]
MKTRAECLQYAIMCEYMAADTNNEDSRIALLATAAHWRTLAEQAPACNRAPSTGGAAMSKGPPVLPASRSPKRTGSKPSGKENHIKPAKAAQTLREQGDAGDVELKTRNHGYQQHR